jgi:cell division protein FtsI (penicillin-binding protein 3)
VFADPSQITERAETAARMAAILQLDAGEVEERIRSSGTPRFCWLKRRVAAAEAEAVRQASLAGIGLVPEHVRHYPLGSSMGQVIGFVGDEGKGLEGLELSCNDWLAGEDGYRWTLRDTRRRPIRASSDPDREEVKPRDGGHVILTIDSVIQGFVEERLARQVKEFQAESGVGVVMDPRNGDVLAMACYPPFDPNDFRCARPEDRRNRVVTDMVEPGSTFKPFVASGALVAGVVRPDETIYCHDGLYVIGGRRLHDAFPHGNLTFEQIVVKSSNIGMAILAGRMGNQAIYDTVRGFGFGRPTGIDFPGEAAGSVVPLRLWTSYSTTSVPMGHEIAVTPLQMVTAFSAIANDGVRLKPRLIRARLDDEGSVVDEFTGPEPVGRALPIETARYFTKQVLVAVVNGTGSASNAAIPGYQVLGKTGTAQVPYADRRGYEPNAYLASFVGAAPAEDPQVAVLVMIRKPNPVKGYYGGVVSAPVVGDVLASTLAYLQVPPTEGRAASAR